MRAGVIDVGSNTVRLLVAEPGGRGLDTVLSDRTHLGMGADIERTGSISEMKLERLGELVSGYGASARQAGTEHLEVIVTAPGRQSANASLLHRVVGENAGGVAVRQLSAEDEGRLAYAGAVSACRDLTEPVGVIDVGGGSSQLMVGTAEGPAWLHCLDIGSLRLTARFLDNDPPTEGELAAATAAAQAEFAEITPPLPRTVLATGGTARSLRRIAGRRLGAKELSSALTVLTSDRSDRIAEKHGVPEARARVLPAGTILLREAHRRLGVKLEVARGGVREGAVLGLLDELAATAA
jgi:exopolyphosphatase/guanosine-5'-triphosphate,3'-diphosphate pyrophosphatase